MNTALNGFRFSSYDACMYPCLGSRPCSTALELFLCYQFKDFESRCLLAVAIAPLLRGNASTQRFCRDAFYIGTSAGWRSLYLQDLSFVNILEHAVMRSILGCATFIVLTSATRGGLFGGRGWNGLLSVGITPDEV